MARFEAHPNDSASQVSEINKGLNDQVQHFRTRPLEAIYPFLWIDALYEKVRVNGRVIGIAIMVAHGVNLEVQRDILAVEPMFEESTETWSEFFESSKTECLKASACVSLMP